MKRVIAMILAGGAGDRLSILSEERAKPAVIFGGKYRVIDFVLSNCVHSGISRVGVLTQYRPRSLHDHIGIGRPWDLDRAGGGVAILQPFVGREASDWYRGTADAVYQNLHFIEEARAEQVVILAGDHVYKMKYEDLVGYHLATAADVTVPVYEVPAEQASRFGAVILDEADRIIGFEEKPPFPRSNLISMGIYVFNTSVLFDSLRADAADPESSHDFGRDILPRLVDEVRLQGYRFHGYWRDIGTIDSYYQANMDLLVDEPELDLYDRETLVLTRTSNLPPARIRSEARVSRAIINNGCIINGHVENSVLSPGVHVAEGAVIRDSIIFDDCRIERGAVVKHAILDKEVVIGESCYIGYGDDFTPNRSRPDLLHSGLTLIGKRARLPASLRVGRNCIIGPYVEPEGLANGALPSGSTVTASDPRRLHSGPNLSLL